MSGIEGSYGTFIFSFCETLLLFSIVAVPIYIPTNGVGRFPLLQTSPAFIVCRFFDDGHSDLCEVLTHCLFYLHFSDN